MKTLKTLFMIALLSASIIACPFKGVIYGKISEPSGRGISKVRVELRSYDGSNIAVLSNAFGYYQFPEVVGCGNSYTLSVSSKRYSFSEPEVSFIYASGVVSMQVDFVSQ